MREILLLVSIGILIGVPVAIAGGRVVKTMLFGLQGTDVLSLLASVLGLFLIALLAGYLPARRASLIEPVVALRYE